MRTLLICFLMVSFTNLFSQEENYHAKIPRYYEMAGNIALLNSKNDTVMHFKRKGRDKFITYNGANYVLKKRKILIDSNNDTIAFVKRKTINFPSQNQVITERKHKHGWSYYADNQKILEINYKFNREDYHYYITMSAEKFDTRVASLIKICLGRFDKRVNDDYINYKYEVVTTVSSVALIAILMRVL